MSSKFNSSKMYTYLKGMAVGLEWHDTIKALAFAREKHGDQTRKNGEPYIVHPLTMASHAAALGIRDDQIMAAALLHDVVEDCNISVEELPVSDETKEIVKLLSYQPRTTNKQLELEHYYGAMKSSRKACIVKLLDRCNNVSTMAGVFTPEKVDEYIEETRKYILPLLRWTKDRWPEESSPLFILKYQIMAVIDGLEACTSEKTEK